jgi:hypothetical protein
MGATPSSACFGGTAWNQHQREAEQNHLTNVKDQPWYGYGGAWGQVGNPIVDKVAHDETTGPQGPSHKKPAPDHF